MESKGCISFEEHFSLLAGQSNHVVFISIIMQFVFCVGVSYLYVHVGHVDSSLHCRYLDCQFLTDTSYPDDSVVPFKTPVS